MPRKPRYEVADPAEVQVFLAAQRCVRRAFLCGEARSRENRSNIGDSGFVLDGSSLQACSGLIA